MRQVLFYIPLEPVIGFDIPIYGFGTMLFVAFVLCAWVGGKLAEREGIARDRLLDLAIWIFLGGIIGGRIAFMIQFRNQFQSLWQFFALWQGGLIFYGSAVGGTAGFFLAYFLWLRQYKISPWKMVDIVAPCAALGLCLGRVGCLLNGCCYGHVACPDCPGIRFPLPSPAARDLAYRGYQAATGFTLNPFNLRTVDKVEPNSPADLKGLKPGDEIRKVDGMEVTDDFDKLSLVLFSKNEVALSVRHANGQDEDLPPFRPRSLSLHPTQIYESISMAFLFLLLMTYYPLRRHDGSVMELFMLAYAVHRFLNEMLRDDTPKVALDMTLSQNISLIVLVAGLILAWMVRRRPPRTAPGPVNSL